MRQSSISVLLDEHLEKHAEAKSSHQNFAFAKPG
jgi:hypothetical protein